MGRQLTNPIVQVLDATDETLRFLQAANVVTHGRQL
jgi:hypothetical protein